jgi:hypothetical protein
MTKTIVRHAAISAVSYGAPPTASNSIYVAPSDLPREGDSFIANSC